jgi:hypothetical protein
MDTSNGIENVVVHDWQDGFCAKSDFGDFLEQAMDSVYWPLKLGFTLSLPSSPYFSLLN